MLHRRTYCIILFKVAVKRVQGRGICATSHLNNSGISALTIIRLKVNGMVAIAIVNTGCSKRILNQNFVSKNQRKCLNSPKVVTFEGMVHQWIGSDVVTLEVDGIKVRDEVISVDFRPFGVDMMLGMNSIRLLGGVSISPMEKMKFGSSCCGTAVLDKEKKDDKEKVNKIKIKKNDREAVFIGVEWRVKWKWRDGEGPDRLCNKVAQYGISKCAKTDHENKLHDWIKQKWLLEYNEKEMGPPKGQIPLMAVIQRNKDNNVRPVLD